MKNKNCFKKNWISQSVLLNKECGCYGVIELKHHAWVLHLFVTQEDASFLCKTHSPFKSPASLTFYEWVCSIWFSGNLRGFFFSFFSSFFFGGALPHQNEAAKPMWVHPQGTDQWSATILPWSWVLAPLQWAALIILSSWRLRKEPSGLCGNIYRILSSPWRNPPDFPPLWDCYWESLVIWRLYRLLWSHTLYDFVLVFRVTGWIASILCFYSLTYLRANFFPPHFSLFSRQSIDGRLAHGALGCGEEGEGELLWK